MTATINTGELRIVGHKQQFDNKAEGLLKEIARIQKEIALIQAECEHKWVLVSDTVLKESKVKNVYIIGDANTRGQRDEVILELRCALCNQEKSRYAREICVRCLCEIKEGKLHYRKEYFGEDYLYFSARLGCCVNCGLSFVWDEWDQ